MEQGFAKCIFREIANFTEELEILNEERACINVHPQIGIFIWEKNEPANCSHKSEQQNEVGNNALDALLIELDIAK